MLRPFILKRLALLCAMTLLISRGGGRICPAYAQRVTQFDSATQPKMLDLSTEFMRDIGSNLKKSDLYLRGAVVLNWLNKNPEVLCRMANR